MKETAHNVCLKVSWPALLKQIRQSTYVLSRTNTTISRSSILLDEIFYTNLTYLYFYSICSLAPVLHSLSAEIFELQRVLDICISQLDLALKQADGGDISSFVTNGEWDLIGK